MGTTIKAEPVDSSWIEKGPALNEQQQKHILSHSLMKKLNLLSLVWMGTSHRAWMVILVISIRQHGILLVRTFVKL